MADSILATLGRIRLQTLPIRTVLGDSWAMCKMGERNTWHEHPRTELARTSNRYGYMAKAKCGNMNGTNETWWGLRPQ